MKDIDTAEHLSGIAGMVKAVAEPYLRDAFLYAEAEQGFVSTAVFKDVGELVQYCRDDHDLAMKVLDLWYSTDPAKKWGALLLSIEGETFDARFVYPDEWGDDDDGERRQKVLFERYGDKPVRYPSIEELE